jgi:hypothetical protein
MSHVSSGIKNLLEGIGVFIQGLAVVVIMAISYAILWVKKAIRTMGA